MRATLLGLVIASHAAMSTDPVYWSQGSKIQFMISDGVPSDVAWEIKRFSDGDIEIVTLDTTDGSELGTVMFVEGMFLVSRGEPLELDQEFRSIERPIVMP